MSQVQPKGPENYNPQSVNPKPSIPKPQTLSSPSTAPPDVSEARLHALEDELAATKVMLDEAEGRSTGQMLQEAALSEELAVAKAQIKALKADLEESRHVAQSAMARASRDAELAQELREEFEKFKSARSVNLHPTPCTPSLEPRTLKYTPYSLTTAFSALWFMVYGFGCRRTAFARHSVIHL